EHIPLNGTYVLELNSACEVHIGNYRLQNYQETSTKFKNIELPHLQQEDLVLGNHSAPISSPTLQLDAINLRDLDDVKTALNLQHRALDAISPPDFDSSTTGIWIIVLYAVVVLALLYIGSRVALHRYRRRT